MKIDGKEISKELLAKAMQCDTPEELVALAKAEGFEITMEEAEAYMDEMYDIDLDHEQLKQVAGGYCPFESKCQCNFKCPERCYLDM